MRQLIERMQSLTEQFEPEGSVKHWMFILKSKITQADARQSKADRKKGIPVNIYRLGHWLKAAGEVEKALRGKEDSAEKKDLLKLKAALSKEFTPDSSPANFVKKGIDKFLSGGKPPKITAKGGTALVWK
jgi:hypothetical protein